MLARAFAVPGAWFELAIQQNVHMPRFRPTWVTCTIIAAFQSALAVLAACSLYIERPFLITNSDHTKKDGELQLARGSERVSYYVDVAFEIDPDGCLMTSRSYISDDAYVFEPNALSAGGLYPGEKDHRETMSINRRTGEITLNG